MTHIVAIEELTHLVVVTGYSNRLMHKRKELHTDILASNTTNVAHNKLLGIYDPSICMEEPLSTDEQVAMTSIEGCDNEAWDIVRAMASKGIIAKGCIIFRCQKNENIGVILSILYKQQYQHCDGVRSNNIVNIQQVEANDKKIVIVTFATHV